MKDWILFRISLSSFDAFPFGAETLKKPHPYWLHLADAIAAKAQASNKRPFSNFMSLVISAQAHSPPPP